MVVRAKSRQKHHGKARRVFSDFHVLSVCQSLKSQGTPLTSLCQI